jgi:hypothetical protein
MKEKTTFVLFVTKVAQDAQVEMLMNVKLALMDTSLKAPGA